MAGIDKTYIDGKEYPFYFKMLNCKKQRLGKTILYNVKRLGIAWLMRNNFSAT